MCIPKCKKIEAHYISDEIYNIQLPLDNLPELGDIPEQGIFGYILISNREEITIITSEEEYEQRQNQQSEN